MKVSVSKRPSPAIIVAVVALAFAMVGTAIAGTDGLSAKLTKSKVKSIAKKQADKELKANVSGSHVNLADNATNATSATPTQLDGQSVGRVRLVGDRGSLRDRAGERRHRRRRRRRASRRPQVTHPNTGVYCIDGLSPAPSSVRSAVRSAAASGRSTSRR